MRAVIMELRGEQAAVLDGSGVFRVIPNKQYQIGQVVELPEVFAPVTADRPSGRPVWPARRIGQHLLPVAAALVLAAGTGGLTVYATPCTTLTLDVNPSLGYDINLFDHVVSVNAYNEEAAALLSGMDESMCGLRTDVAVEKTLIRLQEDGYLSEDETPVLASVSGYFDQTSDRTMRRLHEGEARFQTAHGEVLSTETVEVSRDVAQEARRRDVSAGKLERVRELRDKLTEGGASPAEFDEEAWLSHSVQEIEDAFRQSPASQTDTTAPAPQTDTPAEPAPTPQPDASTEDVPQAQPQTAIEDVPQAQPQRDLPQADERQGDVPPEDDRQADVPRGEERQGGMPQAMPVERESQPKEENRPPQQMQERPPQGEVRPSEDAGHQPEQNGQPPQSGTRPSGGIGDQPEQNGQPPQNEMQPSEEQGRPPQEGSGQAMPQEGESHPQEQMTPSRDPGSPPGADEGRPGEQAPSQPGSPSDENGRPPQEQGRPSQEGQQPPQAPPQ